MKRYVGLMVHPTREAAHLFANEVIGWLAERGIGVRTNAESAAHLSRLDLGCDPEQLTQVEFIITLGGDGTILQAARMASPCGIPILGVHMGQFGFIAELHPSDLFDHLETILAGHFTVEQRVMVQAEVWRNNHRVHTGIGLNEIIVKSGGSRLLRMSTTLRGVPFATYPADGLIVATPTGSTGYALSAGGPLVMPTVQALLIVPNNPHTLSARPLIVPGDEVIGITIESEDDDITFAADGVEVFPLEPHDRIEVRQADAFTRLIVLDQASFYRKVRARYLYGERLNH